MDASAASEETLADVLGARAMRSPMDRLVLDIVGGILVGAAAIWARPTGWFPLALAAMCFASYGSWAIAERRLRSASDTSSEESPQAWLIFQQATATIGVASFVVLLFALLGVALGPIKS